MNENATNLKMTNTNFDSPHGLMNIQNLSTAYDMARLASKAMQSPTFRKIVATKNFICRPYRKQEVVSKELTKKFNKTELEGKATIQINDWDTGEGEL